MARVLFSATQPVRDTVHLTTFRRIHKIPHNTKNNICAPMRWFSKCSYSKVITSQHGVQCLLKKCEESGQEKDKKRSSSPKLNCRADEQRLKATQRKDLMHRPSAEQSFFLNCIYFITEPFKSACLPCSVFAVDLSYSTTALNASLSQLQND